MDAQIHYLNIPFLLQIITMHTVAITIAITAQPTAIVVRIATSGTFESPEFDHFDPTKYRPWLANNSMK